MCKRVLRRRGEGNMEECVILPEQRCKLPDLLLLRRKTSVPNGKAEQGLRGVWSLHPVWAVGRWLGDCFLILVLGSAEPNRELLLLWA